MTTRVDRARDAWRHCTSLGYMCGALAGALLLSACATYHRQPLPTRNNLAQAVSGRLIPLDMNRVATLAVINNPDLNTARAAFGVARAQAFAAGLLPDPQFVYTRQHPTDHPGPKDWRFPEFEAYGLELDINVQALMTHGVTRAAAGQDLQSARLQLLWQEWQTVAQARTLFVQQSISAERRDFLANAQRVYTQAVQSSQRAQAAGNATLEQTSADLALLQDVDGRLGDAQRSLLTAQQGLRSLLGVAPGVLLTLQALPSPIIPSRADVQGAVQLLPQHRPDLLALRAGYQAQEQRVRLAVLSQFPNISVGFTKAVDTSDIHSIGGLVNISLPLFNRGRGDIAIQRATRAQLRADYQARLDQAVGMVWQLWDEMQQVQGQLSGLQQQLPQLQQSVQAAERAYSANQFPAASYLTLIGSYLAAQELQATLRQALWSDSIAVATILGTQVQPRLPSLVQSMNPSSASVPAHAAGGVVGGRSSPLPQSQPMAAKHS